MKNPFILIAESREFLSEGDSWARLALICADRARACWDEARQIVGDAETASKELAAQVEHDRAEMAREWAQ